MDGDVSSDEEYVSFTPVPNGMGDVESVMVPVVYRPMGYTNPVLGSVGIAFAAVSIGLLIIALALMGVLWTRTGYSNDSLDRINHDLGIIESDIQNLLPTAATTLLEEFHGRNQIDWETLGPTETNSVN